MDGSAALRALVDRVGAGEVEAVREVRRLTWASATHRRKLDAAGESLIAMLCSGVPDAGEATLLVLLNLAVRDESHVVEEVWRHWDTAAPTLKKINPKHGRRILSFLIEHFA